MYKTYQFRVKDSSKRKILCQLAARVNYLWNMCNEISYESWSKDDESKYWVSKYDMQNKLAGKSKELNLNSATIQLVVHEHSNRRNQFKKSKLNWRSRKRSLGWVPFDTRNITIKEDGIVKYSKQYFRLWNHRGVTGKFKSGCFHQNAKGQWFISLVYEQEELKASQTRKSIGIDLGLKNCAVTSEGEVFTHPKPLSKYATKLATAQRAKNKKQVTNIHYKIKNIRKDFNHKLSTYLVEKYDQIFVGDVSSTSMLKKGKGFAKSTTDASWGQLRTMLAYKANRLGKVFQSVKEAGSTVTCSNCNSRCGPSGLSSLGVRSWICNCCGIEHSRDVNAAKNILSFGFGHETPSGSPYL